MISKKISQLKLFFWFYMKIFFKYLFKFNEDRYFHISEILQQAPFFELDLGQSGKKPFLNPSSGLELSRLKRILTKEPETIDWINSFESDTVLFDIGANIGVYSLYSLIKHKSIKVIALEPEPGNFSSLIDNLQRIDPMRAIAYQVGISSSTFLASLERQNPGGIGTNNNSINSNGGNNVLGCIAFSIDDLVYKFNLPFPNYIKIDVDGIETQILLGAQKVLPDKRLKSILVEAQSVEMATTFEEIFLQAGFKKCAQPLNPERVGNRIYFR